MEKLIITGDIHGEWKHLNNVINHKLPNVLIVCGDFGYWPRHKIFDTRGIKNKDTQIFWCPGNHEDWESIEKNYIRNYHSPIEIAKDSNIFYCPIGSTIFLNGLRFLFVGGADSVDKDRRLIGYDWFPQEVLNYKDCEYLMNINHNVDVVISHTCPSSFKIEKSNRPKKYSDPTRVVLQNVLEKFKPILWFFGHFHTYMKGKESNCVWEAFDYPNHVGNVLSLSGPWWRFLK